MSSSALTLCKWCCLAGELIFAACLHADDLVLGPNPGPSGTASIFPFLIKQLGGASTPTMRYQQVYSSSLFTNVNPASIYVTSFEFRTADFVTPWVVPNFQIDLSTTFRRTDTLSSVFAENVGLDDTKVFGPGSYSFPGGSETNSPLRVYLDRGFRYDPQRGNLLLDVRIYDGSGSIDADDPFAALLAYGAETDEVSRVWSTNVLANGADGIDSIGVATVIQLSPIPALTTFISNLGTTTNFVLIRWRTQPPAFTLQRSLKLNPGTVWQTISTLSFSNTAYAGYWFPVNDAGAEAFFRLVGPAP